MSKHDFKSTKNSANGGLSRRHFLALAGTGIGAAIVPFGYSGSAFADPPDAYDLLRAKWATGAIADTIDPSDPDFAVAISAMNTNAQTYYNALQTSPSRTTLWADLPLGSSSSNLSGSFSRLKSISYAYAHPAGVYYGSPTVAAALASGLDWLVANYYTPSTTEYANWYDWEIASPSNLVAAAVMIYSVLGGTQIANYCAAIDHFIPSPLTPASGPGNTTGANGSDICVNIILRGILAKSSAKIAQGAGGIPALCKYSYYGDGLYPDGSFIFHGNRCYAGSYGLQWLGDIANMVQLLAGSTWAITDPSVANVYNGALNGFRRFCYNGLYMDSSRGRAIGRPSQADADMGFYAALNFAQLARTAPSAQATQLNSIAKGWLQANGQRPFNDWAPFSVSAVAQAKAILSDTSITPASEPIESYVLADCDRSVHRRSGWAYNISMCSTRVTRYEALGAENVHGWHTGDGMTYLYIDSDPYQFTDMFWPTVNPYRLPGVTGSQHALANGYGSAYLTNGNWVGGASNGIYSAIGVDLTNVLGFTMSAKKSWFQLDDCIVALGAGITATGSDVIETIVENRNLGDPTTTLDPVLTVNGTARADALGTTQTFSGTSWASIDGVAGYVFLDGPGAAGNVTLTTLREDRTGNWSDIGGSSGAFTRRYQTLWLSHGTAPSGAKYAYITLPNATDAQTAARASSPNVSVLANTTSVQAISHSGLGLTAANFFAAGSAGPITVNAPASVVMTEAGGTLKVSVSDPSRSAATLTVTIARSGYVSAVADAGAIVLSTSGSIILVFEVGGSHGASKSVTLSTTGTAIVPATLHVVAPNGDAYVRDGSYASTNYGSATQLVVKSDGGTNTGYNRIAYFTFTVHALSTLKRAILWLRGNVSDGGGNQTLLQAYKVSVAFTEGTTTWNNRSALQDLLGSGMITTRPDWVGLDVTSWAAAIANNGYWTLNLAVGEASAGLAVLLNSREAGSSTPFLEVITQ